MKKGVLLCGIMMLSSCIYAGNHENIGAFRNDIFSVWNGYSITFYDDSRPELVKTEMIEDRNYKKNESATAYRGYSVLNSKRYRKDYYSQVYLHPNKSGALNTASVPHKFEPSDRLKLLGEVSIDGQTYRLVPSEMKDFVFLIDKDGAFYNKMGKVNGGSLILLDPEFFPYPDDLRLVEVASSSSTQTKPVEGFDVKYDGIRMDRIWFTYLDYADKDGGRFENISFPNKPGLIEINGIGFRILNATDEKIDYMVLKD